MKRPKIVIVKTGDTFPSMISVMGDFEDWIARGLGQASRDIQVVNVAQHQPLPHLDTVKGVVVAGSHAMVTENLDWSLELEAWIPKLIEKKIPLLGICYGHQLMARAMGGTVDYHPEGLEIGTTDIACILKENDDPLFAGFPQRFKAHVVHSQTVIRLPASSVAIAKNEFEPHHAFRIGPCAWGVQFHPEYDAAIETAYVENMTEAIAASGQDPAQVLDQVVETPVAAKVLSRFGALTSTWTGSCL
jgi:GMP synthase (glutamine-hydrolysing)